MPDLVGDEPTGGVNPPYVDLLGTGGPEAGTWPQILDCVASCLELPEDALTISRGVLREYGNMSSPTIFFIMRELIESKADGTCLAMAFGPGLTIELVLMRIDRSGA